LGEAFLTFRLGDAGYSIPARFVREVQPFGACTPLPSTPPCIIGLVNVRGRLLAALDLRPLLDLPPAPPRANASLIILLANDVEVGLLADAVKEVRRIADATAPTLMPTTNHETAWVRGVDRNLNLLLDPPALFAEMRDWR